MSVSPRPGRSPPTRRPHSLVQAPPLLRWLSRLDSPATDTRAASFAEQLSPWLDWTDAIALSSVLSSAPTSALTSAPTAAPQTASRPAGTSPAAAMPGRARPAPAGAWATARSAAAQARQVHAGLVQAIRSDATPLHGHHQRAMDERIAPARVHLRAALAACTPPLRQLAALDEVLDRALAVRERRLLAALPRLFQHQLEHQNQFRHRHPQAARGGAGDAGTLPADPDALRDLLLAELHARWQPVDGLLQALDDSLAAQPRAPA